MSITDQIIGVESGGNPNARNPRSSASGLGQFIDSTWLSMMAKHRPDIQGRPEDLLALKSDPTLSREMTEAYAADNGAILSRSGLPVTPSTTYLAHFAGPQGAVKVLQADPSAPIESILGGAVIGANPFLKGMTAADLQAWSDRKMGGAAQPQKPASPSAASLPASVPPLNLPMAAPQQQQPAASPEQFWSMVNVPQVEPFEPILKFPTRNPPKRRVFS